MALKPIKKKRLFEEIILAIERYIQEEQIMPGGKLPSESELAEEFQVSKTAVREAMTVLQTSGILEVRPGVGIFLKENGETIGQQITKSLINESELRELFEFRRSLEVEAATLAALRASPEDLRSIERAQASLEEANRNGQLGVEEDYLFHSTIIDACHNSLYQSVFNNISEKLEEGIGISKMQSAEMPGRLSEGNREHRQIVEALLEGDSKKAAEAMREHLVKNERKLWGNQNPF